MLTEERFHMLGDWLDEEPPIDQVATLLAIARAKADTALPVPRMINAFTSAAWAGLKPDEDLQLAALDDLFVRIVDKPLHRLLALALAVALRRDTPDDLISNLIAGLQRFKTLRAEIPTCTLN